MNKLKRGIGVTDFRSTAMVLAFDPGGTTGWCAMGVRPESLLDLSVPLEKSLVYMDYGEISSYGGDGSETWNGSSNYNMMGENVAVAEMSRIAAERYQRCAIVLEDFVLDPNVNSGARELLSPVRLIAAFSYAMTIEHEIPLYERTFIQNRSPVKTTCTNERLKEWGLFEPHPREHMRDATRHAFYFLREARGQTTKARELRWRAWPHLFTDPVATLTGGKTKSRPKKINPRIEGLG